MDSLPFVSPLILILILTCLPLINTFPAEGCASEGMRISDSENPNTFYACQFYRGAWIVYPLQCRAGVRFDSDSQACRGSGEGKSESLGLAGSNHGTGSFNRIPRLLRSLSGVSARSSPLNLRERRTEGDSDLILSLASSIKSLASTVEQLAGAQKTVLCNQPTSSGPARPTSNLIVHRLPTYEIIRPPQSTTEIRGNTLQIEPSDLQRLGVPIVESKGRKNDSTTPGPIPLSPPPVTTERTTAGTTGEAPTQQPIQEPASIKSEPTISTTTEPVALPGSTTSTTPPPPSSTLQSNPFDIEDYDQGNPSPHHVFPVPGNNLFDFLFKNVFQRPSGRPDPHSDKQRLPQRSDNTTPRSHFGSHSRLPPPSLQPQMIPIRIPILQHTNSLPHPNRPFPVPPGGQNILSPASLFNHFLGIGSPIVRIGDDDEESAEKEDEDVKKPIVVPGIVRSTEPAAASTTATDVTDSIRPVGTSTPLPSTSVVRASQDEDTKDPTSRLNDRQPSPILRVYKS